MPLVDVDDLVQPLGRGVAHDLQRARRELAGEADELVVEQHLVAEQRLHLEHRFDETVGREQRL
ncbi:MAG: hypothetical protein ACJ8C9_13860, partial [Microvirga sp.]